MKNWLKIVNSLLLVSFLIQAFSGLLLFWLGSETIANIHKYNGLLFILLVIIHITLNWNWIKSVLLKRERKDIKKVLLALFAVVSVTSVCFAQQTPSNTTVAPTKPSVVTTPPASAKTTALTGKVEVVSNGNGISGTKPQITVKDGKGQLVTLVIESDTAIIGKDGSPTSLNWLGREDKVTIEYATNKDGTQTAKSIKELSAF